jgi:tagaturonate epimerase
MTVMTLPKYSMGIGDRFARQGKAQLAAFVKAKALGVDVTPVWNKSNREHLIVHSEPASVRAEADAAVKALGWREPYFVDADHIGLKTVDGFLASSDFFTIDVADFIGKAAPEDDTRAFAAAHAPSAGSLRVPGVERALDVTAERIESIARKYLYAVKEAGNVYRHIERAKGAGNFIAEVSMDETDQPQTPVELLFILAAIGREPVPVQTIAPKFTGRFNKGVDYVGDLAQFEREFTEDLAVIAYAVKEFGLPADLKLSVHSGSDKFSIYPAIRRTIRKTGAGLHIKTAGTTWLEELIGLASAGAEGLTIAKDIYAQALGRFDELCGPYASVIDIDRAKLPSADDVSDWDGERYAQTLRHDQASPRYNPHFRQLLHVGYKVAAQMGERYTNALEANEQVVAKNVTENLFDRHLKRVFIGD